MNGHGILPRRCGDTINAAASNGTVTIIAYAGTNSLTGAAGLINSINGGSGADTIVGGSAGDSGANTTPSQDTSEATSSFDVVYGLAAGNKLQLATQTPSVNLTATNLAGTNDVVNFARGTYNIVAETFTYSAVGTDTAPTYDTSVGGGTAFETIILVGYASAGSTDISNGVITFA